MPYSSKEARSSYNSKFLLKKYHRRRQEAIAYLGGKCVDCGNGESLEFDHRSQSEKSFSISKRLGTAPWEVLQTELDKCDLRCVSCHAHMTAFQKLQNQDILGPIFYG